MAGKKSFRLLTFTVVLSGFSGISAITSGVFLKSYNNSLIIQKQNMERQIDSLEKKNESCKTDLNLLQGNDRIVAAAGKGMSYQPERVIIIRKTK